MRVATITTVAACLAVIPFSSIFARAVEVGSCDEFEAVDRKTDTEVTITNADFACNNYKRLNIRSDMVLRSFVGAVTLSNLGLKIYGSLTVQPDMVFTGITDVVGFCVSCMIIAGKRDWCV